MNKDPIRSASASLTVRRVIPPEKREIYDGKTLKVFKGTIYGTLSPKDKGKYGFGFDKVFIPKGYKKTLAQMPPSLKNKISHRAKVLEKVKGYFSERSSASLVLNH